MSSVSRWIAVVALVAVSDASRAQTNRTAPAAASPERKAVVGPFGPMNEALAAGSNATVIIQPVQPKTVPMSSYPAGSAIMGQTLILGTVPARVWLEMQITGWAPEDLKVSQVTIDATDQDQDGGGYDGDLAECNGNASIGAGDLLPAEAPCQGGTCHENPTISCLNDSDCPGSESDRCNTGRCQGNQNIGCRTSAHCTDIGVAGPCINFSNVLCRAAMSGLSAPCSLGEPSRCNYRPPFYPPGGYVCEANFIDRCDAQWIGVSGLNVTACDNSTANARCGILMKPGEVATDFAPSYLATVVIDVPADAKGTYFIDVDENQTYMQNFFAPPDNTIPIAVILEATIRADTCSIDMDCDDQDLCTVDTCQGGCCEHTPIAGWNPSTECCHPMTGAQGPIPASTPCRIGACSLGGSSGTPTFTELADGTPCTPEDRCYLPGECADGACDAEEYAGSDCLKSRFISFEPSTGTVPSAYRVRLVSLHHPSPPYRAGVAADFSAFEGQYRWVGPADTYVESSVNPAPVHAAELQCDPHYADWSPFDLLHVTGHEVVPSSVFEVQSIEVGLDINNEANYSAPIVLQTDAWGDVVWPFAPPSTTIQPDASDHTEVIDKFKNLPDAISKVRAVMTGANGSDIPDLTLDVDFGQVSANIDAFRGLPYPFAGPQPCP